MPSRMITTSYSTTMYPLWYPIDKSKNTVKIRIKNIYIYNYKINYFTLKLKYYKNKSTISV